MENKEVRDVLDIISQNEGMLKAAQKRASIDSEKVQKTVSSYLQIARDDQLNYNELQQVFTITKDSVLQSLNSVSISVLPITTSEAANV